MMKHIYELRIWGIVLVRASSRVPPRKEQPMQCEKIKRLPYPYLSVPPMPAYLQD